jgi:flagellar motility protein MotE (MotC chaperone)
MMAGDERKVRMRGRAWLRAGLGLVLGAKLALLVVWGHGATATAAAPAAAGTEAGGPRPAGAVRPLLEALQQRQAELETREREVAGKEARLKLYERDVTARLASLEEIEKRLATRAKAESAAGDAATESLAKIYGAMKPADAAPILERLDEDTVLGILRRMKEKQVGEILPLMSREKAIGLTQALAARAR